MARIRDCFVKCGYCGAQQRSVIQYQSTRSLASFVHGGFNQQCTNCRHLFRCSAENITIVTDDGRSGWIGNNFLDGDDSASSADGESGPAQADTRADAGEPGGML